MLSLFPPTHHFHGGINHVRRQLTSMNFDSASSRRNNNVNNRCINIIDFLSVANSLLDPVSSKHQNSEIVAWYTPTSKKSKDAATKIEQWEDEPQTSEKNTLKNPNCNLRKSLAWDNVFFTSVGVLDPDELSSIIEGVEKETLSRIEEDVYKSCDSISTIGSDSLKFVSADLEGDLFEDARVSIQKSSNSLLLEDVDFAILLKPPDQSVATAYNMFDEMPHGNSSTKNASISNGVQDG